MIIELIGGPRTRDILEYEGAELRIPMPFNLTLPQDSSEPGPRLGIYKRRIGRAATTYYQLTGRMPYDWAGVKRL